MGGANTWSQVGVPYVIDNSGLTVPSGSSLTISPGVVVKFKPNVTYTPTYLNIVGSLAANGTAQAPITFTSYRDDTVLGDTNGDAAATTPVAGDWAYIGFASGATGSVGYLRPCVTVGASISRRRMTSARLARWKSRRRRRSRRWPA